MILIEALCKHYRLTKDKLVKAVDNVNLKIEPKEFILITGRSGSGKTTLLNLISGLTKPTRGSVYIEGIDLWTLGDKGRSRLRSQKLGFIFQFSSLIPTLNVMDNLLLPTMFRRTKTDLYDKAAKLLNMVGLAERIEAYPSQLSMGEQKRVAIARALMNDPEIILADEPTADLDETTEKEIMEIIRKIHDKGATILMVTHNPELANYASRHLKMASGVLTKVA